MTPRLSGIFPMLVTPFDATGDIAFDELAAITAYQLEAGVAGVSVLGLAAEAQALTVDERSAIVRHVLSCAATRPVIVGSSAANTADTVLLAARAADAGAAAVMVAPPSAGTWPRDRLKDHYSAVARAIHPTPLMVQDAPAFIGVALDTMFVEELAQKHPNVQYAKPESTPSVDAIARLAPLPNMGVFGGHGGLYFLGALEAGADGLIPGCEQPRHFQRIYESWLRRDVESARREFEQLLPLLVFQFQSLECFIASVKLLLHAQGLVKQLSLRGRPWPMASVSERMLLKLARQVGVLDS